MRISQRLWPRVRSTNASESGASAYAATILHLILAHVNGAHTPSAGSQHSMFQSGKGRNGGDQFWVIAAPPLRLEVRHIYLG